MPYLGLNIDHVATLRQARYSGWKKGLPPEPSVLEAARIGIKAGARSITVHLREDRRHIQDQDVKDLRKGIPSRLNLEMAATPGMLKNALLYKPNEVCLVPEKRQEVTTEGGLDVARDKKRLKSFISTLQKAKIAVSLFIDPDPDQIEAAEEVGANIIELHTGTYANATTQEAQDAELERHINAAEYAKQVKLIVNAGHGLHYSNLGTYLDAVPHLHTLNIGHAIISRAVVVGLQEAVEEIMALIHQGPNR
jgi:pyridoxine 5-phosphate synthase